MLTREVNEHSNVVDESMVMPLKKFAKLVPNEVKDAIKRRETAADKYASAQVHKHDVISMMNSYSI